MAIKLDTPKVVKPTLPVTTKVQDMLTKAVLGKKVTHDELASLELHIGKLKAILS